MESIWEKKLQHESSTLKKYDLHYLKTITKNFSKDQELGRGGYGIVYKGEQENGEVVAVKKLIMSTAGIDDKQFTNEVRHTMDICHPNIVRLEGYCYQTEKEFTFHNGQHIFVDEVYRFLIFEYLPNGSLRQYLSDESSGLDWHTRYNIIHGICTGLYCLHEGRKGASILHLDLKPTNILLDKKMTPKIADFGLSRFFGEGTTHTWTMNVIGSRGYMAPEYIDRFILSKESDIYSLGVIIVQIVTGHRKYPEGTNSEEFIEVYEKWRTRLQKTSNKTSLEEECRQVEQCIAVGLKCMKKDPKTRPNIREIVESLKRSECSIKKDGSGGEELNGKLVHQKWREKVDIIVSGSAEQSIEALEAARELALSVLPEYIIEDVDRLVSGLILMVQKTFSSYIAGSSSRHCKYTLDALMQVVQTKQLVCAMKKGTIQELVAEVLILIVRIDEDVVKMDEGSKLLNEDLNVMLRAIMGNTDRTSSIVILINLLRPLDPSRWPSCTPSEAIAVKNNQFSGFVVELLRLLKEEHPPEVTINDLDLDLILQSIHDFLEPLGMEGIGIRAENEDMPLRVVVCVLYGLIYLVGSKIKGHFSMVPIDAEPRPIILIITDDFLERFAAAATTSVPPTGQTSHVGDAASGSTNHAPSKHATSPGPEAYKTNSFHHPIV